MKIKKIIFDIDATLLNSDFSKEKVFFAKKLGPVGEKFELKKYDILSKYEDLNVNYEKTKLRNFINEELDAFIPSDFVDDWLEFSSKNILSVEPGAIETIQYLKDNNYEIGILTNWFRFVQEEKLKKVGLFPYINHIVAGDEYLKPTADAYMEIRKQKKDLKSNVSDIGYYAPNQCVMIGDNIEKDHYGAINAGLRAHLYEPIKSTRSTSKIKTLTTLKTIY